MDNCVFCKIISSKIQTDLLYEDDKVIAFKDISPQAPFHILIIPKYHYSSIKDVNDESLIAHLFTIGNKLAREKNIDNFRYIVNTGEEAGQTVFHLHLHLMGGRVMNWPPG